MRSPVRFLGLACSLCLLVGWAGAQTPRPQTTPAAKATPRQSPAAAVTPTSAPQAAARPQFRPAVLRTGPDSLVNRIDVKGLLAKGQKDGAVKFAASVDQAGAPGEVWTYHAMPGSEALAEEVLKRLREAKFTPPIYNHQPVTVVLSGMVIFEAEDAPHLRIFLNQDPEEIKVASDFIAPQPVIGADSAFQGLNAPESLPVAIEGVIDIEVLVDAKGNMQKMILVAEDPPLLGFREAVVKDFKGAKFIPAFRDGDPAESSSVLSVCYKPVGLAPVAEPSEPSLLQGATPKPLGLEPDTLSTPPRPQ